MVETVIIAREKAGVYSNGITDNWSDHHCAKKVIRLQEHILYLTILKQHVAGH